MRTHSTFFFLGLCISFAGCFAVDDLDRFRTDEGCDLQLNLRRFAIHANNHLFTIEVVSGSGESGEGTQTQAIAIFDPLPVQSLDLDMPLAVPPRTQFEGQEGMSIDFWADRDLNRALSDPGDDHTWRIAEACEDLPNEFEHELIFDDLPETGKGNQIIVAFCDSFRAEFRERFEGLPIEVRVWAVNEAEETRRAVALYHEGARRLDPEDPIPLPNVLEAFEPIIIAKAIDADQAYEIEVLTDRNDNGVFDTEDMALTYTYLPGNPCLTSPVNCLGPGRGNACLDGGNIIVLASIAHARVGESPVNSSWWRVVEE